MPELPEVETVCSGLNSALSGVIVSHLTLRRADLRIPFPKNFAKRLEGVRIERITRRAKYLLWHLDSGEALIAHLGMSGCFIVDDGKEKPQKHDHVIMTLKDGRRVIYRDPRRFGLMTLVDKKILNKHELLVHLGPEPLEKEFTAEYLKSALVKRTGSIKVALMDQEVVVGVGNIYASEALFMTGIHPLTKARDALPMADKLVPAIRKVLSEAIASGGSSLKDFVHISGDSGYFQHHFSVYDREGESCRKCKKTIKNIRISGRSSFFCPKCQPEIVSKRVKCTA